MSDNDSTSDIDAEEVNIFHCKLCPGKVFTSAERDEHRQWHNDLRRQPENDSKEQPKASSSGSGSASIAEAGAGPECEVEGFSLAQARTPDNKNSNDDNKSHGQASPKEKCFRSRFWSKMSENRAFGCTRLVGAGRVGYRGLKCKSVPGRQQNQSVKPETSAQKPVPFYGRLQTAKRGARAGSIVCAKAGRGCPSNRMKHRSVSQNLNGIRAEGSSSCRLRDLEGRRATKRGHWLPPDDETWMAFAPGFNVEGECENPQCVSRTSSELPILRRGYGNSCLRKELSICPACNQRTLKAGTVLVSEARCLFNFKKTGVSTGDSTLMEHLGSFPGYVTPDEGNDEVDYDIIEITTVKPTESPFICRWCDTAIGTKANEVRKACGHDFHKNCCSSNCPICSADLIAE